MSEGHSPTTFFRANRAWWAGALFLGPIAGAVASEPLVAVGVTSALVLAALVIFDTDRSWWSPAVRLLPDDKERSINETRKLTLWSGVGLLAGLAIAIAWPWS